jgi:hypothetical protein
MQSERNREAHRKWVKSSATKSEQRENILRDCLQAVKGKRKDIITKFRSLQPSDRDLLVKAVATEIFQESDYFLEDKSDYDDFLSQIEDAISFELEMESESCEYELMSALQDHRVEEESFDELYVDSMENEQQGKKFVICPLCR